MRGFILFDRLGFLDLEEPLDGLHARVPLCIPQCVLLGQRDDSRAAAGAVLVYTPGEYSHRTAASCEKELLGSRGLKKLSLEVGKVTYVSNVDITNLDRFFRVVNATIDD